MTRPMTRTRGKRERGFALLEVIVAIGIMAVVISAFAAVHWREQMLARDYYYRAVAMEIVDGEMEKLVAGEWRAYAKGSRAYEVEAESAQNLPPGRFTLTVGEKLVRLEWVPANVVAGSRVVRKAAIR